MCIAPELQPDPRRSEERNEAQTETGSLRSAPPNGGSGDARPQSINISPLRVRRIPLHSSLFSSNLLTIIGK